jgi:hypothetical protein
VPQRTVASGLRSAYATQLILGWTLLLVFGAVLLISLLLLPLWALVATVERGADAGPPLLAIAISAVVSGALAMAGYGALREVRRLDGLRLVIDADGISCGERTVPWSRIRHATVTAGRAGSRRLLVDDGTGSELSAAHRGTSPQAIVGRVSRRYALDVPLDRLDVPADQLVGAIRRHSGQRLPDL